MKIERLETHDRYEIFTNKDSEQAQTIGECVQDLINQRPFGNYPFYIFSHARTLDLSEKYELFQTGQYKTFEDVPEKRLIHHPRLTKPEAQTNSMLFRVYPGSDQVKIIWMIPAEEMWGQYKKGNITENETVAWSIAQFITNRAELERKEEDDLSDEQIDQIYREISQQAKYHKTMTNLYLTE